MIYSKTALLDVHTQLAARNLATRLSFFSLGLSTAAWAPLIPLAQQRLHLNHADFGLLLLTMGIGSMLSMPMTGALINKFGCKILIGIALILCMIILPLLSLTENAPLMAIILFFFGTVIGSFGVAINYQAVVIEKQNTKTMMSGFHGMCSLGGLCGVLVMTMLLAFGVMPMLAALVISFVLLIMIIVAVPYCISKRFDQAQNNSLKSQEQDISKESQNQTSKPNLSIILIGIVCFIAFLSEGAAMDWSGIYLVSKFGIDASFAGLAYTCFALTMTIGRFSGRHALNALGEQKLISISALVAATGLVTIVIAPHWSIVLCGYSLLGIGCSNIVPIMFSRVGRQTRMPQAAALSLVSTIAYTGGLTGPALVGFLSEIIGLSYVFAMISILLGSIVVINQFTRVTRMS